MERKIQSKKHQFVASGLFKAELDSLFARELAEEGYAGVEVRVTPQRTEVIIMATRTQEVLGEKGRRIRELTALVQKRFAFRDGAIELYAEKVQNRGLCAQTQAESLRYKLIGGLAVRRACYGVLRFIMESGARGVEIIVSGKLRGQRAKSMKFMDGLMIHSGHPTQVYVAKAVRSVLLRQGVLGIQVKIMLPHDPEGKKGPKKALPDQIQIVEPKPEPEVKEPHSEMKERPAGAPGAAAAGGAMPPAIGPGGAPAAGMPLAGAPGALGMPQPVAVGVPPLQAPLAAHPPLGQMQMPGQMAVGLPPAAVAPPPPHAFAQAPQPPRM